MPRINLCYPIIHLNYIKGASGVGVGGGSKGVESWQFWGPSQKITARKNRLIQAQISAQPACFYSLTFFKPHSQTAHRLQVAPLPNRGQYLNA